MSPWSPAGAGALQRVSRRLIASAQCCSGAAPQPTREEGPPPRVPFLVAAAPLLAGGHRTAQAHRQTLGRRQNAHGYIKSRSPSTQSERAHRDKSWCAIHPADGRPAGLGLTTATGFVHSRVVTYAHHSGTWGWTGSLLLFARPARFTHLLP